jgi:hypothetical protein
MKAARIGSASGAITSGPAHAATSTARIALTDRTVRPVNGGELANPSVSQGRREPPGEFAQQPTSASRPIAR